MASVFYKFHHGDTDIQVLGDRCCKYLGFLTVWSYWWTHTINIVILVYLVILVLTRTRNCPACVVKIRSSRRLRVFLEVCTMFGVLLGPLLVLWIPFYDTWYTYGFNNYLCGMTISNWENKSQKKLHTGYILLHICFSPVDGTDCITWCCNSDAELLHFAYRL